MHIVLVNPLIPQNTGSIARLCAGTGTDLHLVGSLGFSLDDRLLKRAGLDYWPGVKLHLHPDLEHLIGQHPPARMAFFSSHATRPYTEFAADKGAWLIFGQETTGLSSEVRTRFAANTYKIPINDHVRSLNLATSVGIVLYEALRQQDFPDLT